MNLGKAAVFGVALFCLFWTEEAAAGITFLSPVDMQKIAGRQSQNKLRPGNIKRREAQADGEDRELGVTIPLDVSMKLTQEQFEEQKAAVQHFLYSLFSLGSPQDDRDENLQGQ